MYPLSVVFEQLTNTIVTDTVISHLVHWWADHTTTIKGVEERIVAGQSEPFKSAIDHLAAANSAVNEQTKRKQVNLAIEGFVKAANLAADDPKSCFAKFSAGVCFDRLGERRAAIEWYEKSLHSATEKLQRHNNPKPQILSLGRRDNGRFLRSWFYWSILAGSTLLVRAATLLWPATVVWLVPPAVFLVIEIRFRRCRKKPPSVTAQDIKKLLEFCRRLPGLIEQKRSDLIQVHSAARGAGALV